MSDIPEELNRKVQRTLHEQGMEMTPDEVTHHRKEAMRKIREEMRSRGYQVPDGDLELLDWMKAVGI